MTQAQLNFPSNVVNGIALTFLLIGNREAQPGWEAVVPGDFNQDSADARVAGLCDLAPMWVLVGAVL